VTTFIDIVKSAVLSDPITAALIRDRFHYGELAAIKDTLFPCANFDASGNMVSRIEKYQTLTFRLWTWSGKSIDEAYEVYSAIMNVLHAARISDDPLTANIVCHEDSRPIYNYDNSDDLHYFMASWSAVMVKV